MYDKHYDSVDTIGGSESCKEDDGNWNKVCQKSFKRILWILPILSFLWLFCTLWICYVIAVSYGHVSTDFTTISLISKEVPERGIYSQLINLGAVVSALSAVVRYLYLEARRTWPRINLLGLFIGLVGDVGLTMSANFEQGYHSILHVVGAGIAFVGVLVYCWVQSFLNYNVLMYTRYGKCISIIQIIISFLVTFLLLIFLVLQVYLEDGIWEMLGTERPFNTLDRGKLILVWAVLEWTMVTLEIAFMMTFVPNFMTWRMKITVHEFHEDKYHRLSTESLSSETNSDSQTSDGSIDGVIGHFQVV